MSDSADADESTDQTTVESDRQDTPSEDSGVDEASGVETSGTGGGEDVSQEELDEIEAERKERLDPDNRPENAEVDNTDRDFDSTTGQFTDHEPDPDLGPFDAPE